MKIQPSNNNFAYLLSTGFFGQLASRHPRAAHCNSGLAWVPHPSSVFCSIGGKPRRPTIGKSRFVSYQGATGVSDPRSWTKHCVAPSLARCCFLRLGWDATNLNRPISIRQENWVPGAGPERSRRIPILGHGIPRTPNRLLIGCPILARCCFCAWGGIPRLSGERTRSLQTPSPH
jgi:hypothetical protein